VGSCDQGKDNMVLTLLLELLEMLVYRRRLTEDLGQCVTAPVCVGR